MYERNQWPGISNLDVFQHHNVADLREAVAATRPNRVLMTPVSYPYSNQHEGGFFVSSENSKRQIHLFTYNHRYEQPQTPITQAVPELTGVRLMNGTIQTSHVRSGISQIYLNFTPTDTEYTANAEAIIAAENQGFQNWVETIREALQSSTLQETAMLQYYRFLIERPLIADVTLGDIHYIATLGKHRTFTLADIRSAFRGIALTEQDNTKEADWGRIVGAYL